MPPSSTSEVVEGLNDPCDAVYDAAIAELREYAWDFGNADPVPEGFADRMEEAGFYELRKVTREDLDSAFADERGIEKGGYVYALTDLGRAALKESGNGIRVRHELGSGLQVREPSF